MSKRRQEIPATGRSASGRWPFVAVAVAVAVALVVVWAARGRDGGYGPVVGRWSRTDGGYVLDVKEASPDGRLEAYYYNPRPIHVARAVASRDGGTTSVVVELRDVNYPGSTYTLTYDAARDTLSGTYYQALEQQQFQVAFARVP